MSGERANKRLRFFDENLGPLAVWAVGFLRSFLRFLANGLQTPRPVPLEAVRTVGILKMAAIGDTVLVSAMVHDLKRWNPHVRVVLFVGGSNEAYARLLPNVDRVVRLPLTDFGEAFRLLREERLDLLFNTDPWPRISAIYGALAKTRWLVGFRTDGQSRHHADDQLVPHLSTRHEIDNFRGLLKAVGIPAGAAPLKPRHPEGKPHLPSLVVFHFWPGGTKSHLKEWSPDRWRQLAILLAERGPYYFVITGSPEQRPRNDEWIQALPWSLQSRFTNLAGQSLEATIETLATARLAVAIDTGIMHVSASLDTPTVVLHGPTRPERWGGIGLHVFPVMSKAPGAGRLHLGFDYGNDENYLDSITVDQVYAKVEKALEVRR